MLGIPFVSDYIKLVKLQPVADSVDWINYYCSSLLLIFSALAISAKQYFGSPIQCWTPNEFKGGWEKYTEDYCFIANMFRVPMDEDVPAELDSRQDQISYYRWVPIVLALQSVFFWMPNYLWNMLHKQTAINPRALVNEAMKSTTMTGTERDKEIRNLAGFIHDTLTVFDPRIRGVVARSGYNATVLYLITKLLYVLNAVGQLIVLNYFLGGDYLSWGYETALDVIQGNDWKESPIFPRVIMCDLTVRRLANVQRHTVQCVIMMNMINEKLYLFLYFWLIFVAVVTFINFVYYLFVLGVGSLRYSFVMANANKKELDMSGIRKRDMHYFVSNHLHADGVLLLHFVRQHIGGRVTYDLLNELIRRYFHSVGIYTPSKSSSHSEQPLLRGDNYKRNINEPVSYKPTMYGPRMLYPNPSAPSKSDDPNSSIDFIDGTLPIRDFEQRGGNSTADNLYSQSPPPKSMSSV